MKNITLSNHEATLVRDCISLFINIFKDGPVNPISEADFERLIEIKSELER